MDILTKQMWNKTIPEILELLKSKSNYSWIWIDTETTGLGGPSEQQITQISAISTKYNFNNNIFKNIGTYDQKIKLTPEIKQRYSKPGDTSRRILSFNRYGSGEYKYREERETIKEFIEWTKKYSPCLLVAQNAPFDIGMLSGRMGESISHDVLDTKKLIQLYFLPLIQSLSFKDEKYQDMINYIGTSDRDFGLISSSMSKIGPALGIDMAGYHDALSDCRITIQMYQKMIDLLIRNKNIDISRYQKERIQLHLEL